MTVLDESLYSYAYASTSTVNSPMIPPGAKVPFLKPAPKLPTKVTPGTPGQPGSGGGPGPGSGPGGGNAICASMDQGILTQIQKKIAGCNAPNICANMNTDAATQIWKFFNNCGGMSCVQWGPLAGACTWLTMHGKILLIGIVGVGAFLVVRKAHLL